MQKRGGAIAPGLGKPAKLDLGAWVSCKGEIECAEFEALERNASISHGT